MASLIVQLWVQRAEIPNPTYSTVPLCYGHSFQREPGHNGAQMGQLQQTGFSLWGFLCQDTSKRDVLMLPTDLNNMGIKKVLKDQQKPC